MSDPALVRIYKKRYGEHWFGDSVQLNGFIVKRFDGTIYAHNMLDVTSAINMQFFVNKKSVLPVQEMTVESQKVFDLIKQQVLIAVVDFQSSNKNAVNQSKALVEKELPVAAEALFKGFAVSWVDVADTKLLNSIGHAGRELPSLLTFSETDGTAIFCCGGREMTADGIRLWGQDVIIAQRTGSSLAGEQRDPSVQQASISRDRTQAERGTIVDPTLPKALPSATILASAKELDDVLAYQGKDTVVFFFSTATNSDMQRSVVKQYEKLAAHFKSRRITSVAFYGYDFNTAGYTDWALAQELPNMQLLPAFQREGGKFKKYLGEPTLDDMATYIKKHADVKFQMKTQNLDPQQATLEDFKQQAMRMYGKESKADPMKVAEDELRKRGEL